MRPGGGIIHTWVIDLETVVAEPGTMPHEISSDIRADETLEATNGDGTWKIRLEGQGRENSSLLSSFYAVCGVPGQRPYKRRYSSRSSQTAWPDLYFIHQKAEKSETLSNSLTAPRQVDSESSRQPRQRTLEWMLPADSS